MTKKAKKSTCTRCERPAYYIDSLSHNAYCKRCFIRHIRKKVRKTIAKYHMITHGDHIAVGLTGGKDSVVLLDVLAHILKKSKKVKLTAVTIDEGISGYREEGLAIATKLAEEFEIEHKIFSFEELYGATLDQVVQIKTQKNLPKTPCSYCGPFRRNAFNVAAKSINATKFATGHNLDDEVETILLNLMRGDHIRFLRLFREPIQVNDLFVPKIRPLVEISQPEVILYALARNLPFQQISCPYAQDAMRNDIRNMLTSFEEKRPGTLFHILHFHDRILKILQQLQKNTRNHSENFDSQKNAMSYSNLFINELHPLNRCKICNEPTSQELCQTCKLLQQLSA